MVFGFNICSGYEYHCLGSTTWILNYALTSHPTYSFWAFQWRSVVVCCTHRPLLDCLYVQHLYIKQCAAFHALMMPVFLPWVATGMFFFFRRWERNDVAPPRTVEFIHLLWETFARIHPFLNTWLEISNLFWKTCQSIGTKTVKVYLKIPAAIHPYTNCI